MSLPPVGLKDDTCPPPVGLKDDSCPPPFSSSSSTSFPYDILVQTVKLK